MEEALGFLWQGMLGFGFGVGNRWFMLFLCINRFRNEGTCVNKYICTSIILVCNYILRKKSKAFDFIPINEYNI